VAICARGRDGLDKAAAELGRGGAKVYAATCDLANGDQVKAYVTAAGEALGGIDVLVNNASGFGHRDDETGWAAGLNIDLMATVRASHAAIPFLEKAGGAIINISSISGFGASVRSAPYAAVKAAVNNYTSSQALTLAPKRIRVNAIAPGLVRTDFARVLVDNVGDALAASLPTRRIGEPQDVANLVTFLCSERASWITGETYVIDGGAGVRSGAM